MIFWEDWHTLTPHKDGNKWIFSKPTSQGTSTVERSRLLNSMKMHTPKTSGQTWIQYWYADSFDYFPRKQVYYDLMYEANKKISNVEWFEDLETNHHNIIEILKDIPRTFTNYDIFAYHSLLRKLFRILLVFSEYNNGIQYVQGMNSIISILSVHCEEYIAFWLFWGLLENYNLDDIYSIGLEGMYSYINQIDNILK